MKITSVEPQKKNPKRFNIYLDGTFAFGADEDLVVEYRLVLGKVIEQSLLEKLLFEAEVGKLMERMYRLWNIRQRSEKEVRDYLRNLSFKRKIKGKEEISSMIVEALIDRLKKKEMLSDEQFARAWMESRSKKYGPQKIKQELYQRGVSKEIINTIMSNELKNIDQKQTAQSLLQKKLKAWNDLSSSDLKKKAYEFLIRRGFEYEIVEDIVENLIKMR